MDDRGAPPLSQVSPVQAVASKKQQEEEPLDPIPVPSSPQHLHHSSPPPLHPLPHEMAPPAPKEVAPSTGQVSSPATTTNITTSIAASSIGKDHAGEEERSLGAEGAEPVPASPPPAPVSFHDLTILLVPCGGEMTQGRLKIFKSQLTAQGATVVSKKNLSTATHVIVDSKLSLETLLKWLDVPSLPPQPLYRTQVRPRGGVRCDPKRVVIRLSFAMAVRFL